MSNNAQNTKHKGFIMKVLNKAFSQNSKSVNTTIDLNGKLFYVSTSKGRTSVSKIDAFRIEGSMIVHEFGDIMAGMNFIRPIANTITRATEKALWTEHDKVLEQIKTALLEKIAA